MKVFKHLLTIIFLSCWVVGALTVEPIPPIARVYDETATLTQIQKSQLEEQLTHFEHTHGSQIAIVIKFTTKPETIEEYSLRVAETWQLGRKNIDDGLLILIAKRDRALRFEVGYGLEGILNDATCKRIIDEIIVPQFKNGNFYSGIALGLDQTIRLIDGESLPPSKKPVDFKQDLYLFLMAEIFCISFLVGYLGINKRSNLSRFFSSATVAVISSWIAYFQFDWFFSALLGVMAFAITFLARHYNPAKGDIYYNDYFDGSGGTSGSGSSNSFSGGGGSFGGGGSSGSW